jgi:hypothetical protein
MIERNTDRRHAFLTDSNRIHESSGANGKIRALSRPNPLPSKDHRKKSINMHEGIAVWCDCCSCEAEPYWVEIASEMGMELGSGQ